MGFVAEEASQVVDSDAYEAAFFSIDADFGWVVQIPSVVAFPEGPTVSTVRFVKPPTILPIDPFHYDHPLMSEGSIRVRLEPGRLPEQHWDY